MKRMRHPKVDLSILTCGIAAGLFIACCATAEPALGTATHETDRAVSDAETRKITDKMRPPKKVSISVDTSSDQAAQSTDGEKFFVNEIRFTGIRTLSARDLSFITKKYIKREITAQDMKELTREIELEYMRRGIMSSVFIPSQEITDEILRVQVLEPDTN